MKRHPFDLLSFVSGAFFVTVAGLVLAAPELEELAPLRLLGPLVLVVTGMALLLSLGRARQGTEGQRPTDDGPLATEETEPAADEGPVG